MEIRVRIIPDTMVYEDSIPVRALLYRFHHFMGFCLYSSQGLCVASLRLGV